MKRQQYNSVIAEPTELVSSEAPSARDWEKSCSTMSSVMMS